MFNITAAHCDDIVPFLSRCQTATTSKCLKARPAAAQRWQQHNAQYSMTTQRCTTLFLQLDPEMLGWIFLHQFTVLRSQDTVVTADWRWNIHVPTLWRETKITVGSFRGHSSGLFLEYNNEKALCEISALQMGQKRVSLLETRGGSLKSYWWMTTMSKKTHRLIQKTWNS